MGEWLDGLGTLSAPEAVSRRARGSLDSLRSLGMTGMSELTGMTEGRLVPAPVPGTAMTIGSCHAGVRDLQYVTPVSSPPAILPHPRLWHCDPNHVIWSPVSPGVAGRIRPLSAAIRFTRDRRWSRRPARRTGTAPIQAA